MCTVTYIPSKHGCFLTSSRDENIARPVALIPGMYEHNGVNMLYPKDTKANGSWIGLTQTGNAAVLLNGGFAKHIPQAPYRKSRGLVFLDILSHAQPDAYFLEMDLMGIEPFTLVLFIGGFLFEARWNGLQKSFLQLDGKRSYIWSSVTLYSTEVINKRKQWFDEWSIENKNPSAKSIFNFHHFAGDGDNSNSILMNRNDEMLTVSITGINIRLDAATMQHYDILNSSHTLKTMQLETATL